MASRARPAYPPAVRPRPNGARPRGGGQRQRSMAVPRGRARRSATVAATLSFLVPGAGQAYARNWPMALLFGLPAIAGLVVLYGEASQGVTHLAARLLDPAVALTVLGATVLLGLWRVLAVLHAWRSTRRTLLAWLVMPLLVALIVGSHAFAFVSTASLLGAGAQIASGGDSLLEEVQPPTQPGPQLGVASPGPAATPTPSLAPGETATPTAVPVDPSTDDDPYNDEPEVDVEPEIVRGPPPSYDVAKIDTQADGLLNVLIVGLDWMPGRDSRRTDTMIVVSVNARSGEVYMFSFPRDIAQFPLYNGGTYYGKLNSFASYANRHPEQFPDGGMKSLSHQLGYLLGIPIDYYAAVDIPGFEKVIGAIGGVTVNNEKAISDSYINNGEGFYLAAGEHRLNAADAVKYVRSRHGSSDFARARRQQQVLAALRREMARPEKLASLPSIMDSIGQVLRTDFPRDRIAELIKLSEKVSDEPTNSWVFKQPDWAVFTPRSENGGRSLTTLRLDRLRQLSLELFGEQSLYNR